MNHLNELLPHLCFKLNRRMVLSISLAEGSNNLSAYTCKNVGVSRTFPILYKREEVELWDVKLFKVYLLVDSHRVCDINVTFVH